MHIPALSCSVSQHVTSFLTTVWLRVWCVLLTQVGPDSHTWPCPQCSINCHPLPCASVPVALPFVLTSLRPQPWGQVPFQLPLFIKIVQKKETQMKQKCDGKAITHPHDSPLCSFNHRGKFS